MTSPATPGSDATAQATAPTKAESKARKKVEKKARRLAERLTPKDRLRRMGLATLAGVLVFLSFPLTTERDSNIWPLAWIALVPFLESLRGLTGRQGFWMGAWCGLVTNFGGFWWISEVLRDFGHLPGYVYWPLTLLNSFYQGLMFAVFGLFYARALKRRVAKHGPQASVPIWHIAALYTVVEFLFPMIFPWYFANGQYRFLPIIQIAELGGVMSITFVMVAFNAGLHRLLALKLRGESLDKRPLILTFAGTALVLIYGQVRIGMLDAEIAAAPKIKMGLVEADIGIFEKQAKHLDDRARALTLHRNLLKHQHMSAAVEQAGVDLVVWPESSFFPLSDPHIKRLDARVFALTADGLFASSDTALPWSAMQAIPGPYLSIHAPREDVVAVLNPRNVVAVATPPDLGVPVISTAMVPDGVGEAVGFTLVEAIGYGPQQDEAKLVAWVVTSTGRILTGPLDAPLTALPPAPDTAPIRLNAIAMRTGRDGIAVGEGIVEIERNKLVTKTVSDAPTGSAQATLNAVAWGPDRQVALAVGQGGAARLRYQGNWVTEDVGTVADLFAVAFTNEGEAWVGGADGTVKMRQGTTWFDASLPEKSRVVALTVDPFGAVFAATETSIFKKTVPASPWDKVASPGTARAGRILGLAPANWVQSRPFPRDVKWVRQSTEPLTSLAEFDQDPAAELSYVPERDRGAVQRGFTKPLLFGGLSWEKNTTPGARRSQRLYNTAFMLDERGRVVGTYDKVFLLAFGEFMPFGDTFPKLYDVFPQAGDFTAGNEVEVFEYFGHRIGIMVCYEDIMADFTLKLASLSPNVIINVTNDAWFGKTSEPWLHLALSVFRSVENRLALVRSTNTGISTFIDATGRVNSATRIEDAETLVADVAMHPGGTFYSTVGNLFAWLLFAALVINALHDRWLHRYWPRRADPATAETPS